MTSKNSSRSWKDMLNICWIFPKKFEIPRTASRQSLRDNVEHTSIQEYYRHSIFLPFLESLLQQLNDRFQCKTKDVIKSINLMPNNYEKLMSEEEKINVYYATDLINNGADFDQEISLWMKYWASDQKKRYK